MVESVGTESEIFDSQAALGFTAIMNSDFPLPTVIKKKNSGAKAYTYAFVLQVEMDLVTLIPVGYICGT